MNIQIKKVALICSLLLLFNAISGEDFLRISNLPNNFNSQIKTFIVTPVATILSCNISETTYQPNLFSKNRYSMKSVSDDMIRNDTTLSKSFSHAPSAVISNSINSNASLKIKCIDNKSILTDTISNIACRNSSKQSLLDSVGDTIISLSDLNLTSGSDIYHDTNFHHEICYQESTNTKNCSGPYSQSVSNLKDY